jgi:DNA-binding NarL/FixJ family response regulator
MLIRIVALCPSELTRRLQRLVPLQLAAFSPTPPGRGLRGALQSPCDLLLIERRRLEQRAPEIVATLRAQPERPEAIVIAADEDPQDRAALLAAGYMAVVNSSLPDPLLAEALLALIARRREALVDRIRAGHSLGSLDDFASESPARLLL